MVTREDAPAAMVNSREKPLGSAPPSVTVAVPLR
jgi:hypothetical protein